MPYYATGFSAKEAEEVGCRDEGERKGVRTEGAREEVPSAAKRDVE